MHNRLFITTNFIRCLKKQSYTNYHLILIDDGSTDGTAEMVKKEIVNLTILRGNGNLWWGGALQKGFKWIKKNISTDSKYVLIINDDTEFESDFLENGIKILNEHKNTIIQAEAYGKEAGTLLSPGFKYDYKNLSFSPVTVSEEINCLTTRGLLLHIETFIRIGGFYPIMLPHYLSDMEYTIRAYNKGLKLMTHKDFNLVMLEDQTGFSAINENTFIGFLKKHYNFKNMMHPIHWIAFVFLACPFPYNFKNLFLVLKRDYFALKDQWQISKTYNSNK